MTFIQLKYFCEVCKWKSINKAAEHLYVTQPAVSNAIKKLEEELALSLFMRNNNKMILTAAGKYLFDSSIHILREMESLEEKMLRDYTGKSSANEIKIGIPPAFASWCIDLLEEPEKKISKKYNNRVRLALLEASSDKIEDAFLNKKVDLLICALEGKVPDYLEKRTLLQTEIKVCMGRHNPLADHKVIAMEDLAGIPLIQNFSQENNSARQLTQMADEAGVRLDYQYYFERGEAIKKILTKTNAAVFARPELAGLTGPELISIPLEHAINSEMAVLYDNRYVLREEIIFLMEALPDIRQLKNRGSK